MRELTLTVRELLAAAQAERKARLDAGRVDTVFKVGVDRVLLQTEEPLSTPRYRQATATVGRPLHNHGLP